jgi:hypothetical protein
MDIFSDQIGFDIDFITNPTGAQIRVPQGKRYDCGLKTTAAAVIDG